MVEVAAESEMGERSRKTGHRLIEAPSKREVGEGEREVIHWLIEKRTKNYTCDCVWVRCYDSVEIRAKDNAGEKGRKGWNEVVEVIAHGEMSDGGGKGDEVTSSDYADLLLCVPLYLHPHEVNVSGRVRSDGVD